MRIERSIKMPMPGYAHIALKEDVVNELKDLSFRLSVREQRRVSMSDALKEILKVYRGIHPNPESSNSHGTQDVL